MAPPSNITEKDETPTESMKMNADETPLMDWEAPRAQGLYDPQNEHEACGVGFIVAIDGKRNHKVNINWLLMKKNTNAQRLYSMSHQLRLIEN